MTKYKIPKNQVQAWDGDIRRDIAQALPDLDEATVGRIMNAYKTSMMASYKEGGEYYDRGFGTYNTVVVRAHTRRLPDGGGGCLSHPEDAENSKDQNAGMKFKAAEAIVGAH